MLPDQGDEEPDQDPEGEAGQGLEGHDQGLSDLGHAGRGRGDRGPGQGGLGLGEVEPRPDQRVWPGKTADL